MESILAAFVAALLSFVQPYATQHEKKLTHQDTMCLAEAVYHEGRGEADGGTSMAYAALNRVARTGKTICQVVHASHQFSYYNPRHPLPIRELDAWKFSVYVAVYTQLGLLKNQIGNSTSYNEHPVNSWLDENVYYGRVEHHYFYRLRSQPDNPPLVPIATDFTPPERKLVFCNTASDNRVIKPVSSENAQVASDAPVPIEGDAELYLIKRQTVDKKEPLITSFSESIPFPAEPSLSCKQIVAFTSVLLIKRPHAETMAQANRPVEHPTQVKRRVRTAAR